MRERPVFIAQSILSSVIPDLIVSHDGGGYIPPKQGSDSQFSWLAGKCVRIRMPKVSAEDSVQGLSNFLRKNGLLCSFQNFTEPRSFVGNRKRIKGALADMVSGYLANLVDNFLSGRTLWYGTDEGPKEYIVTAGVPQGSVLGALLWNIMYNGVLALPVLERTTIVGFADDLPVVVIAKYREDVDAVKSLLERASMNLADTKNGSGLNKET